MFQTVLSHLYPELCPGCGDIVDGAGALCATCWPETPFIHAPMCDSCGIQLPGEAEAGVVHCDDCLTDAPAWTQGRAAMMYHDKARSMVLALKHGDRHDLVHPLAQWMAIAARDMITLDTVFVPVPLHWMRYAKRRYNQSALLAQGVAQHYEKPHLPHALRRTRGTVSLDGKTRAERYDILTGSIALNPKDTPQIAHKDVILVDDVMTSGATLTTCAAVVMGMGARDVRVLTLARVGKSP